MNKKIRPDHNIDKDSMHYFPYNLRGKWGKKKLEIGIRCKLQRAKFTLNCHS